MGIFSAIAKAKDGLVNDAKVAYDDYKTQRKADKAARRIAKQKAGAARRKAYLEEKIKAEEKKGREKASGPSKLAKVGGSLAKGVKALHQRNEARRKSRGGRL